MFGDKGKLGKAFLYRAGFVSRVIVMMRQERDKPKLLEGNYCLKYHAGTLRFIFIGTKGPKPEHIYTNRCRHGCPFTFG